MHDNSNILDDFVEMKWLAWRTTESYALGLRNGETHWNEPKAREMILASRIEVP